MNTSQYNVSFAGLTAAALLSLAAFFVFVPHAYAIGPMTVYVDSACTDTTPADGNCDAADTYKTIQEGVDAVASGGTVNVAVGVGPYSAAVNVNKSVTVDGGGAAVVSGAVTVTADNVTLNNLIFSGDLGGNAAIDLDADNAHSGITISNNHFTNSITTWHLIRVGGSKTHLSITGNVFAGSTAGDDNGLIYLGPGGGDISISNNTFGTFPDTYGFFAIEHNANGGARTAGLTVSNNTINYAGYSNSYGTEAISIRYADDVQVSGNTLVGSATADNYQAGITLASVTSTGGQSTIDSNSVTGFSRGIRLQRWAAGDGDSDNIHITNNTVSSGVVATGYTGSGVGMYLAGVTNLTASDNTITGNANEGVYLPLNVSDGGGSDITGMALSDKNNMSGNGSGAVSNLTGTSIDARQNYWGDASGPYNASSNPSGTGDSVSDDVTYEPWYGDSGFTTLISKPTVTAVSSDGVTFNVSSGASQSIVVTFDKDIATPPTISVAPDDGGSPAVTDCGDGNARTFCIDYGIPAMTEQAAETIAISGAADTDGAMMSPDSGHTFAVDTVTPAITSLTSDAIGGTALKIGDTINFTLATDESVPAANISATYNGQGLTWADAGGNTYTATYTVNPGDPDQTSPLQLTGVTATDAAGNTSETFDGTDITDTIDAHVPTLSDVSISSNNANPAYAKTGDTVTLFLTSNEDVSTPTVTIDGVGVTPTGGPTGWTATHVFNGSETPGLVPFTIDFSDIAGNAGTQVTATDDASSVTYDNVGPTVSSVSTTNADGSYKAGDAINFTVTFNEPVDVTGTPTLLLNYNADKASYSSGSGTNTLTFTYTVQAGDTMTSLNYASASALAFNGGTITDLAGNSANLHLPNPATFAHSINLDTTAPTIAEATPIDARTADNTPTYTFTTDEDGTIGSSCAFTSSAAATVAGNPNAVDFDTLADGAHSCSVTVTDAAGNVSNSLDSSFTVDTTGPVVTDITTSDADGIVKQSDIITITAVFDEDVANTPTIQLVGADTAGPTAMTAGSDAKHWTYEYTAGAGDGTVTAQVYAAQDDLGNVQATTGTVDLTLDNTAPSFGAIPVPAGTTGETAVARAAASDSVGVDTAQISVNGGAYTDMTLVGTLGSTKRYTYGIAVPSDSTADITYQIQVSDAAGNTTTSSIETITVTDNDAPTIALNGTDPMSVLQGNTYTEPGATATDNVDGTFAATVGGDVVDTNTPGSYVVTYDAQDAAGNNATQATRTVNVSATDLSVTNTDNGDGTSSGTLTNAASSTVSSGGQDMTVEIPAGIEVTGGEGWDGTIGLPTVSTTYTSPTPDSGTTVAVTLALEVGSSTSEITFDKGVRLVFAGQSGSRVGWSRGGTFTEITSTCASDSQATGDALPAGGDCKINVGSDLVVWTRHFTTFLTYTQTTTSTGGGGGGGGGNGPIAGGGGGGGIAAVAMPNNGGAAPGANASTGTGTGTGTGGQVLGAAVYNFQKNFGVGATGADVTALQQLLIDAGYLKLAKPTGIFGGLTRAALVAWQKANGISPASGYVGPLTRGILNRGTTPSQSDEKASLIQSLQQQLQALLNRIRGLSGTSTATSTTY